jgi:hypothetical protein
MGNSEYSTENLVAMSADYFAANPDVEHLVVVVGTGTFYRPERESIAKDEATVAHSTTTHIMRSQLPVASTPSANAEVPEFPAVVGTLELALGKVKLVGALPRQLAEVIYQSASQQPNPEAMMEAVVDFLLAALAVGLDSVTYTPQPVAMLVAAEPINIQLDAFKSSSDEATAPSLADVVAGGKLFVFAPSAPAIATETAAKPAKPAKATKAKAAPKKKASTKVKAA